MMLCCLHDGFNGTVGLSLSQVFLESISEDGQLTIGLEATEGFLGLQQAGGGPSERHLGVSPAFALALLPTVRAGDAVRTRRFVLDMGLIKRFTINGASMNMERVNEVVPVGEAEIWEIINKSWMAHPFHVHDTQFRILDRGGKPPHPGDAGLKDTVVVFQNETVRILVQFDEYTDPARPYMYHCHNLEHEDAGMMGQFTVV